MRSLNLAGRAGRWSADNWKKALFGWLLFALIAPPTWLLTALAPRPAAAWRVNRLAARLILRLAGIALTVRGLELLPRAPCVLVANHASYLDGILLAAALPAGCPHAFVAKRFDFEVVSSGSAVGGRWSRRAIRRASCGLTPLLVGASLLANRGIREQARSYTYHTDMLRT